MSDEKKPFTVRDRRHFAADGTVRSETPPVEVVPAATAAARAERPSAPTPSATGPGVDLASFLLSLGAQASRLLEAESPDVAGVRSFIAIFEMLREKTEGRRTPDEDKILDAVLYELRMGYLSRTGVGGA
jgi:hypothetical protein